MCGRVQRSPHIAERANRRFHLLPGIANLTGLVLDGVANSVYVDLLAIETGAGGDQNRDVFAHFLGHIAKSAAIAGVCTRTVTCRIDLAMITSFKEQLDTARDECPSALVCTGRSGDVRASPGKGPLLGNVASLTSQLWIT